MQNTAVGTTNVTRAIEVTSRIESSVEELYSYLTVPSLLERWLCSHAETNPQKGGDYRLWINADISEEPDISGNFINLVPNRTVQYVWLDDRRSIRSLVTVVMNQREGFVRVDLYHTSIPMDSSYDNTYAEYAKFWQSSFQRLTEHLAE